MANSSVHRLKRALIVTGIVLVLLGAIYLVSFTTCSISNAAALEDGSNQKPAVALVAKYARKDFFKVGDLLLVEMGTEAVTTQTVCRIEAIHQPDESKRPRVRGRGRQLAQAAIDMDFKPTYSVSLKTMPTTNDTTNASMQIHDRQILGKVIWIFGD